MKTADWHQRFRQQAQWSQAARTYFLNQNPIPSQAAILEVGCGTGAVLSEFQSMGSVVGVDIERPSLTYTKNHTDLQAVTQADGFDLPLPAGCFDLTFCHYLLLWLKNPLPLLAEMKRVTKPGGWVCLFAEPDYSARIDSPPPLEVLGLEQNKALTQQGIRLDTGRLINGWLHEIGLQNTQSGLLGGHWNHAFDQESWSLEWATLFHDLSGQLAPDTITTYQNHDRLARLNGQRVLFIPTFYAWGQKPAP